SRVTKAKPFDIPKREVWEAFKKVKANRGAAGVDGQSIAEFETALASNLYRLWNRLSSGSYFPPPVRRVTLLHGGCEARVGAGERSIMRHGRRWLARDRLLGELRPCGHALFREARTTPSRWRALSTRRCRSGGIFTRGFE